MPAGRPEGALSAKMWRDALMIAVNREADTKPDKKRKPRVIDVLVDALIEKARDKDVTALKEVGDRLDGRPPQGVEHSGPGGKPIEFQRVDTGVGRD